MVDNNVIKKQKDGYAITHSPTIILDKDKENKTIIIAVTLAKAFITIRSNSETVKDFNQRIIVMATCYTPQETLLALGAELQIFSRFWNKNRFFFNAMYIKKNERFIDSLPSNLISLNSAYFKFTAFINNFPQSIVQEASTKLDRFTKANWELYWPTTEMWGTEVDLDNLRVFIKDVGNISIKTLLLVYYWQYLAIKIHGEKKEFDKLTMLIEPKLEALKGDSDWHKYDSEWKTLKFQSDQSVQLDQLENTMDELVDRINAHVVVCHKLAEKIDLTLDDRGLIKRITEYSGVLIFQLRYSSRDKKSLIRIEEILNRICKIIERSRSSSVPRQYDRRTRIDDSITILHKCPEIYDSISGIFECRIVASGDKYIEWLVYLAAQIIKIEDNESFFEQYSYLNIALLLGIDQSNKPYSVEGFSDVKNESPFTLGQQIIKHCAQVAAPDIAIYSVISPEKIYVTVNTLLSDFLKNIMVTPASEDVTLKYIIPHSIHIKRYCFLKKVPIMPKKPKVDIAIIVIVPDELITVIDVIEKYGKIQIKEGQQSQRIFRYADITYNSKALKVCVTQTLKQGNRSIISAINSILDEVDTNYLFLVGIAGGMHQKVKLGQVVIGTGVLYADDRVEHNDSYQRRAEPFPIPAWELSRINDYFVTKKGDPVSIKLDDENNIIVYQGNVASSEAVLRSNDSNNELRKFIRNYSDKILCIDKEAGGFSSDMFEKSLKKANPIRSFIFRGISDYADPDKEDTPERSLAASNAFIVSLDFATTSLLDVYS